MPKRIKSVYPLLFLLLFMLWSNFSTVAQEQKKDENITEYVEVINTEVIVRAFDHEKGTPVEGLTKEDFILYENGKEQTLTSIVEHRHKIGTADTTPAADKTEEEQKKPLPKRFFFLYFRITDPFTPYEEALDHFFNHIYRSGDYILIMVESTLFKITREEEIALILPKVKYDLGEKARMAKLEIDRMQQRVELAIRTFEQRLKEVESMHNTSYRDDPDRKRYYLDNLKREYRALWDEYKYKYVHLDSARLKAIAASLKTVKFEKWGLVFYQHDTFPLLNQESIFVEKHSSVIDMRELRKMIDSLTMEMRKPERSLPKMTEVRQAFIDANITFHLMLCQPRKMGQTMSQYLTIGHIYSDRQETFRRISSATGGKVIDKTDLKESLDKITTTEDIYYRLTYAPLSAGSPTRRIEVKVPGRKLDILYSPEVTLKKLNEITIGDLSFSHPTLEFTLKNYQQLFDGTRMAGDVEIKTTAIDENGEMSMEKHSFTPGEIGLMVSLKLNFPRSGTYSLIVEALDKQTGKTATVSQKIIVPRLPDEMDPNIPVLITGIHEKTEGIDKKGNLETLLQRAAAYCRKLGKATFYFTCTEEIIDTYILKGKEVKKDVYTCDYQIVMDEDGKMDENRTLVMKNGDQVKKEKKRKKKRKKKFEREDLILTNFYSNYPFLLPETLLGQRNQKKYRYQLLAKEKINERDSFKISVEPIQEDANGINHGVVWLEPLDGAVVKIELNPNALKGVEKLQGKARHKGAYLKISDIHHYNVKEKGIRFPSGTEISETYIRKKMSKDSPDESSIQEILEEAKTIFSYLKYRFFNVNVNIIDTGHE